MSEHIRDILFESIELGERGELLNKRLTDVLRVKFPNVKRATTKADFFSVTMDNGHYFFFNLKSIEPHFENKCSSFPDDISDEEIVFAIKQNKKIKDECYEIFNYIKSIHKDTLNGN